MLVYSFSEDVSRLIQKESSSSFVKRILVIEETNKGIVEYVERFVKVLHALLLKVSSSAVALFPRRVI